MKKSNWVNQYLLNAPKDLKQKARTFADPQSAWEAWDDVREMFWMLDITDSDKKNRVLTICDIVETCMSASSPLHLREAIAAIRQCVAEPIQKSGEIALEVREACSICLKTLDVNSVAYDMVLVASHLINLLHIPTETSKFPGLKGIGVNTHSMPVVLNYVLRIITIPEKTVLVDIVRKHFPVSPFFNI